MKKLIMAASFAAFATMAAFGQASGDYKKSEFFVGYSNGQVDTGVDSGSSVRDFFRDRESFNGVNVSGVYNLNRYFGVKGDVSATFNNTRFTNTFTNPVTNTTASASFDTSNSLYNVVGGVQLKDNAKEGRLKPFAHAMVGLGHARTKIKDLQCTGITPCPIVEDSFSDSGFSGVFGGGLDIRLGNRFQIRAIQVDYNPVRINGDTSNNVRIGAGIVF